MFVDGWGVVTWFDGEWVFRGVRVHRAGFSVREEEVEEDCVF